MKLVIAVVQDKDSNRLLEALVSSDFKATRLASTGGFLRAGNTTYMIGANDEQVDEVLKIIKNNCKSRNKIVAPMSPMGDHVDVHTPFPVEIPIGGATVFVLPVEKFEQF